MVEAYKKFWQQYADFQGRSSVSDYWWAFLANVIVSGVLSLLITIAPALSFLTGLFGLAALIPGLALFVRRMNDCGRKWTNIFWALLPIVGLIILIIRLCEPSQ